MATTPTPALIAWKYADWRGQPTVADQIARMKLHLQEVEGFLLESSSKGRSLKLADGIIDHLQEQLARLERRASLSRIGGNFGVSSYQRGSGP